jgi:general secretion pathway protein K
MQSFAAKARSSSEQGFVLVAVLWLLAALAALAVIFSAYLSNTTRALSGNDVALQAEALMSASVELTAYQLQLAADDTRPARGSFRTRLNGAELIVSFVSEAARIDLNAASKELLTGLFSALGASEDDAREAGDRIVGWRSRSRPETAANEDALYRAAGRPYSPRQAPFAHINELSLVLGISPALTERALPFLTLFNGNPGIDPRIAAPEVLAAMPGMTPLILKQFLDDRAQLENDTAAIAAALGAAKASVVTQKSETYRLLIRIHFPNGRDSASEVVITLAAGEDPYRVLSWQDGVSLRRRTEEL